MGITANGSGIAGVYCGNNEISEIYKGGQLVYQNRPTKWLHVTPVLATLSRTTWNATTEYGDCTGAKEFYRDQSGYRVIHEANMFAGSDAAWYDGDYSTTTAQEGRVVQSNINTLIHYGPGIDFSSPREIWGICIKVAGASIYDIPALSIAVRYPSGITNIIKTANTSFGRVVKKMVYYFEKPTLVSSVIITKYSLTRLAQAVSRSGIYLLTKGGNLNYEDIPGDEIN